jgi:hypothetical protein
MNWTHVSESLPEMGTPVLLTDGKTILVGLRVECARGKGWRWAACGVTGYDWTWEFEDYLTPDPVTHWMPLPAKIRR